MKIEEPCFAIWSFQFFLSNILQTRDGFLMKQMRIPCGSENVCKQRPHQHTNDEWWCLKNPSSRRGLERERAEREKVRHHQLRNIFIHGEWRETKPAAGNARDGCKIDSNRIILSFTSLLAHRRCTIHQEFIQQALWILIVSAKLFLLTWPSRFH